MKKQPFNFKGALEKRGAKLTDDQVTFVKGFEDALEEILEARQSGQFEEDDFTEACRSALKDTLGDEPKNDKGEIITFAEQIRMLAESMDKLEKRSGSRLDHTAKFQLRKMIEDNKEQILDAIRSGKEFKMKFDALRVAATHLDTNTMTDAGAFIMPDVENFLVNTEIARI